MIRVSIATSAALLAALPAAAAWRVAETDHFIVYSEDKPEALREFAIELERYDSGMRVLRGIPPRADSPGNKLTIFAVSGVGAVQKLGGGDRSIAGFYSPRAGGSVAFVPRRMSGGRRELDADEVLRHEYAHHFMFRNYPAAFPLWFSEGFAEFHSTARVLPDGSIDFGLPAQHRSIELFHMGTLPIETLLQPDRKKLTGLEIFVLYGRGWLLTHFLTLSAERKGQLGAYLTGVNAGKSSLDAAKAAFGDLKTLNAQLDAYKRQKMNYMRLPVSKLTGARVDVRELSPGADAIMPVFIQSRRGVTTKTAGDVAQTARQIAARYPADPFVQSRLAEAEFDADNLAEAEAAADRILAADPDALEGLMYKGRVAVARLAKAKSTDADAWRDARRWFARANRAESSAPRPPIEFYESYIAQGIDPTPNAIAGLKAAQALAPEDGSLRFTVARQWLREGKAAEARAMLAVAAYGGHSTVGSDFAATIIGAIDEDGAEGGTKAWTETEKKAEEKSSGK